MACWLSSIAVEAVEGLYSRKLLIFKKYLLKIKTCDCKVKGWQKVEKCQIANDSSIDYKTILLNLPLFNR
ncbi:MAG: hypothetical protein D3905_08300 [Candidatus Electrothrix sp. AS4_5]|nr:hypothetical protein [Candidatus Electrothrix gigas]